MTSSEFNSIKRKIRLTISKDKQEEFEKHWDELCDLVDPLVRQNEILKDKIKSAKVILNEVQL